LQFGYGAQLKNLSASFHRGQMGQQNGRRIVLVVFQRKSRARQPAGLPQFFNRRIVFAQGQQPRRRRTIVVVVAPGTRWSLPLGQGSIVARLSDRSRLISAGCRCVGGRVVIVGNGHFQAIHDVCISRPDLTPVFVHHAKVATGDNRRQRKILIFRHRGRNDAGWIEPLAFGLPLVFEPVPRMPAAPVLLGIKHRNQYGQACQPQKEAFGFAPGVFRFFIHKFILGGTPCRRPKLNQRMGRRHAVPPIMSSITPRLHCAVAAPMV